MKRLVTTTLATALLATITLTTAPYAEAQKKAVESSSETVFKPRLPFGYGKLGVNAKQRANIYTIQKRYHPQLEDLRKQLEELEAKRDKEIEDILTADQKAKLKKYHESKKKD